MTTASYLFKGGRTERIQGEPVGPTEFFYGYVELKQLGMSVGLLDERQLGMGQPEGLLWKIASRLTMSIVGIHAWAVNRLRRNRHHYSSKGAVLTVNNAYGVAFSYLKARGKLEQHVIFIAMGLLPLRPPELQRRFYAWILKSVTLTTISKSEQAHLAGLLPDCTVHYTPFGVDQTFWTPDPEVQADQPYILSVGNDPHRDYDCLISAWRKHFPKLRLITRLKLAPQLPDNVEVQHGDWRSQALTDEELRDLVRGARFVVLPIRETIQPSGQSACLQAMACGKAVVLSDISGLWDRGVMKDGENCILVPPGDAAALQAATERLLQDPELAERIGSNARLAVEQHFNTQVMANAIRRLIEQQSPEARAN